MAALVFPLLHALPARAAAGYSVVDLGTLGGSYSGARAINSGGDVAGTSTTAAGDRHAFLSSGGAMQDLGTLGGTRSEAYAVNDARQVVGESTTAAGDTHAFLYSGGGMLDLGTLGGSYSSATAINAAGQVVGSSTTAAGDRHAFLYSGGVMHDLGTLGGAGSEAHGINDAGQVVGTSEIAIGSFSSRAFVDDGGAMTGIDGTAIGPWDGAGINGAGQVVGTAQGSATGFVNHAFLMSGGLTTDIGVLLFASFGADVNGAGDAVGYSTNIQGGASAAFLYTGGVLRDLTALLPAASGWVQLRSAYGINNGGQIAGTGYRDGGAVHAFVLTPAPPPDTTPPAAPSALAVQSAAQTSLDVSWSAATDNAAVGGYDVDLSGNTVGSTTQTTYTLTGLKCSTDYTVGVEAVDTSGNASADAPLDASTAPCPPAASPSVSSPAAAGPIAAYPLDDGSGAQAADGSGGSRAGSLVGEAAWSPGRAGGALSFDGASGHVDLPSLGGFFGKGFTLEAWVKPASTRGDAGIVGSWQWSANGGPMLWIDGSGNFALTLNRGLDNYLISARAATPGRWQHVSATYDGTTARLFVDGVEVASRPFAGDVGDSDVWRIGAYGGSATGFFDGSIDDVRIYDRALSTAEIATDIAAAGAADTPPPEPTAPTVTGSVLSPPAPVATYSFEGDTGTTAVDGAAGNNGTASDGAQWTTEGRVGGAVSLGADSSAGCSRIDLPALGTFYKRGFTLAAWVDKRDPAASDLAIVGTWTASGSGGPMLWIDTSGRLDLTLDSGYQNYLDSGFVVPAGEWHHVAATYDGVTAQVFVDGRLTGSKPFAGDVGDSDTWRIGAYGESPTGCFGGSIDDVRIYNGALSPAEIANLAAAG